MPAGTGPGVNIYIRHTLSADWTQDASCECAADERAQRICQVSVSIAPDALHRVEGQHVVLVDDDDNRATANEATCTLLACRRGQRDRLVCSAHARASPSPPDPSTHRK